MQSGRMGDGEYDEKKLRKIRGTGRNMSRSVFSSFLPSF
jgi:hypothetical protein